MRIIEPQLSASPFIADLTPRERSIWRFLATLFGGLAGGLVAGLALGALTIGVFVLASYHPGQDITLLRDAMRNVISPASPTLFSSIFLMLLAVVTNGPVALTFAAIAALIAGVSMRRYVTAAPSIRWPMLLAGLGLSVLALGPLVVGSVLFDPHAKPPPIMSLTADPGGRALYAFASIALLIPAAAAEELVFRGWLLRQSAALTRNPIVLMAANGVLFSAVHLEFAPEAFFTRALMGAGFVYMTLRLGGIEFSTGAHAANNILIVLFLQPLTATTPPAPAPSLESVLQDVFLLAAYIVMAEVTVRWAPLRRWTGADRTTPAIAEAEHFD